MFNMNISEESLAMLKCYECDSYLSFSPIMIKDGSNNICGRCYIETEEEKLDQNHIYEALASNMLFPCRYKNEGCTESIPWNKAQFHEEGCNFQQYPCLLYPIGKCEWSSSRCKLLTHFQTAHPDCCIKNHPVHFKPNIRETSEKNFLVSVHEQLFLLQTKCSVPNGKLSYCVRFLGYPNLASVFDFTITMKTNLNELKKTKVVANQKNINFERDNFIDISINSLLINLGKFEDISFILTINKIPDKYKLMECYYCGNFRNSYDLEENKNFCKNCSFTKEIMRVCKYNTLGCSYSDVPINVKKHEKWFCSYNKDDNPSKNKCIACRLDYNEDGVLKRQTHSRHKAMYLNIFNRIYKEFEFKSSSNIIFDNIEFSCAWEIENNILTFKVVSDISKTKNKIYILTLVVYNPCSNAFVRRTLEFNLNSLEYDWIIKIKNDVNNPFISKKIYSHVEISFGLCLSITRNDTWDNMWNFYDLPNLGQHNFKDSYFLTWKDVVFMSCIKYIVNVLYHNYF